MELDVKRVIDVDIIQVSTVISINTIPVARLFDVRTDAPVSIVGEVQDHGKKCLIMIIVRIEGPHIHIGFIYFYKNMIYILHDS